MSSDQEPRRRRAAGTGPLVHAGAATAQTKSLRRYRKRQEQRFAHKASALRQYKKAMKKEGYEAGRGAGRKRYRDGQEDDDESGGEGKRYGVAAATDRNADVSCSDDEEGGSGNRDTTQKNKKRRKKIDPMADIRRKAEEKREERSRIVEEREQKKKTDAAKERQRKKNFRTKQKRTRKGQPIMGDMIKGMLEKLQKDAGH